MTDEDGNVANKTYSLLQKENRDKSEELNDFNDIEEANDEVEPLKKTPSQLPKMESDANQDLKNSMFQDVFGYE